MAGIGAYNIIVQVVPTTLTQGTTYFAMQNTDSTKIVHILSIVLSGGFTGTAGTTTSLFGISRFSVATPTGGTASNVVSNNTFFPTSAIGDARFAAGGLTTTGITFDNYFFGAVVRSNLAVQPVFPLILNVYENPFVLNPGEGLAIRAGSAIISGAAIYGGISWYELPY